ncbi:MAG: response regulator transcription factor [Chloroflexi bacterium]|nr:response regulator transcription factor [Chloroflexota bacterium]
MAPQPGQESSVINVLLVDDHQIFRHGIQMNLELHDDVRVVGQCADGEEALQLVAELTPDVVLMDINMPRMNGIQVARQLMASGSSSRIVMLTAYDDLEQVIHVMRAGASAYLRKEIEPGKLMSVIRAVSGGLYVIYDEIYDEQGVTEWIERSVEVASGHHYIDEMDGFSPLSPREMEILRYVTEGLSNKEIASRLNISHQTVKNHMTSILRKLSVEDRTQAAVYALRRGWVRLDDPPQSSVDS